MSDFWAGYVYGWIVGALFVRWYFRREIAR